MSEWFDERCLQLRDDLNEIPSGDDASDLKLKLIRVAMRQASLEMFRRAVNNSRENIKELNSEVLLETMEKVERTLIENISPDVQEMDNIMHEFENMPGIAEAMTNANEKFREDKAEIATEKPEESIASVSSEPLKASDLDLSKVLRKPGGSKDSNANTESRADTPAEQTKAEEPQKPSPKAKIQIKSSILRRND